MIDYDKVKAHILEMTNKFNHSMFSDDSIPPTKGEIVSKLLSTSTQCDKKTLGEILSVILGEEVESYRDYDYPNELACVRMLTNENGHRYPLGEILIHLDAGICYTISNGLVSNHIETVKNKGAYSKVTEKEVELAITHSVLESMKNCARGARRKFRSISKKD